MSEAEPIPDFLSHLEGGIEELKTSSFECSNLLTFMNEVSQLSELDFSKYNLNAHHNSTSNNSSTENIVLTTTLGESDFMTQIFEVHKKLSRDGRHPVGKNGVYHIFGLVKFAAYKWLSKIKFRKDEPGRIQVHTYAMPTTYSKYMAKNEIFFYSQ